MLGKRLCDDGGGFIYVFSVSISSYNAVIANRVMLWPIGFSMNGYRKVISDVSFFYRLRQYYFQKYFTKGVMIGSLKVND